jgi:hypothetical protein
MSTYYELVIDRINKTASYRWPKYEEPIDQHVKDGKLDVGAIFRFCRDEFGRCTGAIYRDKPDGSAQKIGWCFEKRERYEDTGGKFLQETWVSVRRTDETWVEV